MSDIRKYVELLENAEKTPISEGVKFGNKQKQEILSSSKINVGIEYEFHTDTPGSYIPLDDDDDDESDDFIADIIDNGEVSDADKIDDSYLYTIEDDVAYYAGDFYTQRDNGWDEENAETSLTLILNNKFSITQGYNISVILSSCYEIIEDSLNTIINYEGDLNDEISDNIRKFKNYSRMRISYSNTYMEALSKIKNVLDEYKVIANIYNYISESELTPYTQYVEIIDSFMNDAINKERLGSEVAALISNDAELIEDVIPISNNDLFNIINQNDFSIGLYEEPTDSYLVNELPDHDIIEQEYDGQIEVITKTIPLKDGLDNIKQMFDHMKKYNHQTSNKSGMHVSISNQDWKKEFNAEKFFMLMNIDSIHSRLFGSREHVDNFNDLVKVVIKRGKTKAIVDAIRESSNFKQLVDEIYRIIDIKKIAQEKYQSINLGSYESSGGRVELRYIGGEDYEHRYEEIEQEILRAAYLLELGYNDLYEKEYQKYRYIYLDKIIQESWGHGIVFVKQLLNHVENNPDAIDPDDRKTWKFKGYDVNPRLVNILYV